MIAIKKLEERVDELANRDGGTNLTTEEANSVREFWIHLHWTPEEAEEYHRCHERMDAIAAAAGSVYLNAERNQEYMKLSARATQLAHDVCMKRVIANHTMRDKIWPELAPHVLRYWKLLEMGKRPVEELTHDEAEELKGLMEWFDKLRVEAVQTAERELAKTSGRSGGESENCQ